MRKYLVPAALAVLCALPAGAAEVNVYTARHYDSDLKIYDAFSRQTGIKVNVIEASGDELLARVKAEGAASPADVLITVDGGRLHRMAEAGLFQPLTSAVVNQRVPQARRNADDLWFGLTTRARVIFYSLAAGKPEGLARYEDLADPRLEGQLCIRSSSNAYNVSLMAEMIAANGVQAAEEWARGLTRNLARKPQGGDRDQIRAVAAGECTIAVANTYYWGGLAASDNPADRAAAAAVGMIFPNQEDRGAHVNLSGAGLAAHAPHPAEAVQFLEFLVSDEAQRILADGNNEYPSVAGVVPNGPIAAHMGFKASSIDPAIFDTNAAAALEAFDRAGMP